MSCGKYVRMIVCVIVALSEQVTVTSSYCMYVCWIPCVIVTLRVCVCLWLVCMCHNNSLCVCVCLWLVSYIVTLCGCSVNGLWVCVSSIIRTFMYIQ